MNPSFTLSANLEKDTFFHLTLSFSNLSHDPGIDGIKEFELFDGKVELISTQSDNKQLGRYGNLEVHHYTEIHGSRTGEIDIFDYRWSHPDYDNNYNYIRDEIISLVLAEFNKFVSNQDVFQAFLEFEIDHLSSELENKQKEIETIMSRLDTLRIYKG